MSVIPFDTEHPALTDNEMHARAEQIMKPLRGGQLKFGDPHKIPPVIPQLNRNPRRHDVVAWRNDGARLDSWRHDTKESALEYARALPWVIYYQYAVTCGRDVVEQKPISIPKGMALDANGMPVKL